MYRLREEQQDLLQGRLPQVGNFHPNHLRVRLIASPGHATFVVACAAAVNSLPVFGHSTRKHARLSHGSRDRKIGEREGEPKFGVTDAYSMRLIGSER